MRTPLARPSHPLPLRTTFTTCALLALGLIPAGAEAYQDQLNSVTPTANFVAIRSGTTASQTFVAGFAGTLTEIAVVMDPRGTPAANLDLSVRAVVNGVPSGAVLASASVAPFGSVNPLVSFDVSGAGLTVAAGDSLAFTLSSTAVLGNDYLARAVPGNKYLRGNFTDSGGAFGAGAGWDAIFRTFVEPANLPGTGDPDQSNLPAPTNNFAAILSGLTAAQTFTVGADGVLTGLEVMVDPRGAPVLDLTLEVQATTGGTANGTILATASVDPFGGPNPMVWFDLGPYNLAVTTGEVLAFVLRSNAAGGNDYLARAVPGDTYAGGQFTNSTGGFASGGGWDAIFETYVEGATASVEPIRGPRAGEGLRLERTFPNPMRSAASLRFSLPAAEAVSLRLYDVAGKRVRTLVEGQFPAGLHEARWDRRSDQGDRVAAGVYFARLEAGGQFRNGRVLVIE